MRAIGTVKTLSFLFIMFLILTDSADAATIVDTGLNPSGTTSGGYSLGYRPTAPFDGQWLAGEFTIDQGYNLTEIKGWMDGISGSQLTAAIYADDATGTYAGEVPGTELYSETFSAGLNLDWYGPEGLSWSLDPGTYWVSFEVHQGDGDDFWGIMPNWQTVPNPLENEAYWYNLNGSWVGYDGYINMGLKIEGNPVPIPSTMFLLCSGLMLIFTRYRKKAS